MMGLPDGRKSFKIGLALLIQYRRVTDTQPRRRSKYALCISALRSKNGVVTLFSLWTNSCWRMPTQTRGKKAYIAVLGTLDLS